VALQFEWDYQKARKNLRKHKVSFEEAASVFGDPLSITIPDPLHSSSEDRFIIIGESLQKRLIVVVHVERGNHIRIISARSTTRKEKENYEKN